MLKNLLHINTGVWEFLIKFPLVLFVIMPGCMGGAFWIGVRVDAALNIDFMKFVLPVIGTSIGIFLTALLIMAGHTKEVSARAPTGVTEKPYSDNLVTKRSEFTDPSFPPRTSIPRAGYITPYYLRGGK